VTKQGLQTCIYTVKNTNRLQYFYGHVNPKRLTELEQETISFVRHFIHRPFRPLLHPLRTIPSIPSSLILSFVTTVEVTQLSYRWHCSEYTAATWVRTLKLCFHRNCFRASAHERLEPQRFFFTAAMERFVWNGRERTDGCFTAAFFQTQHASFSVRCGGHTAVGGGNGTRKNIPACAHERRNNRTATSLLCRSKQVHTSWI
jgi:hypothetical protein